MKGYKKLMDFVALVEKAVLAATMIMILVLTVGNVFSRKVIHQSWSFTEELVVAIFVLITLLGAALSAREGGLVGLNLVTERLPKSCKKASDHSHHTFFPWLLWEFYSITVWTRYWHSLPTRNEPSY